MENSMASMIMDTINNMLIELHATMAQAEIEKKEKRQCEGIQAMKDRGEWEQYGRPKAKNWNEFQSSYTRVIAGEIKPFECMRLLKMTKPTFYRYKRQYDEMQKCGA